MPQFTAIRPELQLPKPTSIPVNPHIDTPHPLLINALVGTAGAGGRAAPQPFYGVSRKTALLKR